MSGAASISAAKNRRTKPDPNQRPIISCSSKSGACPLPQESKTISSNKSATGGIDEESLKITGPLHFMQVLNIHEQRLNKMDDKWSQQMTIQAETQISQLQAFEPDQTQACDAECYDRLSALEEKIQMLEEVIMNLQLTLTSVQNFAMETSLAMMKIQKQIDTPLSIPPLLPVTLTMPVPESVATPAPTSPTIPHLVTDMPDMEDN